MDEGYIRYIMYCQSRNIYIAKCTRYLSAETVSDNKCAVHDNKFPIPHKFFVAYLNPVSISPIASDHAQWPGSRIVNCAGS